MASKETPEVIRERGQPFLRELGLTGQQEQREQREAKRAEILRELQRVNEGLDCLEIDPRVGQSRLWELEEELEGQ